MDSFDTKQIPTGQKTLRRPTIKPESFLDLGGIKNIIPILIAGVCYQVGRISMLLIKGDAWLYNFEGYTIPDDIMLPQSVAFLRDSMDSDEKDWDHAKFYNLFPRYLGDVICNTPILDSSEIS